MKIITTILIFTFATCLNLAARSISDLRHEAEQGKLMAQLELGGRYEDDKNYTEAIKWYRTAAENGLGAAAYRLGAIYRDGKGAKKDKTEAARWFLKAAENGTTLGLVGLENTNEMALIEAEYRKAAEQGDATTQIKLGRIYAKGWGGAINYPEAIAWHRKAAEQGNAEGQFILGTTYMEEQIVAPDYAEALEWFYKAAAQGHAGAQGKIGLMYYLGTHVIRDEVEAAAWYYLALSNGGDGPPASLEKRLGLSGRQQAQQRAKELAAKIAAKEPLK
jgi:TPR repeat protein